MEIEVAAEGISDDRNGPGDDAPTTVRLAWEQGSAAKSAVPATPDAGPGDGEPGALSIEDIDAVLDAVEQALGRLDDGTYGRCEECAAPIDDARLATEPTARTCSECTPVSAG